MQDDKPTWKRISEKTVYTGRMKIVTHEAEIPSGEHITYEVDHFTGFAAAVLIKTKDNKVVLCHQFRFPVNRWIYDLPGGGSNDGETPEQTA